MVSCNAGMEKWWRYLSTSRGSNWAGIACILCWPGPISCGFTAISWFLISISCRCRSSDTKHTQFCCQGGKLGNGSGCSVTLPVKIGLFCFLKSKSHLFLIAATKNTFSLPPELLRLHNVYLFNQTAVKTNRICSVKCTKGQITMNNNLQNSMKQKIAMDVKFSA